MDDKIWIIRDSNDELPSAEEAATFRDWFTRNKFAPRVNCKEQHDDEGKTLLCEWQFWSNETGVLMTELSSENAMLRRVNVHHVELLESLRLAVAANDKATVKNLLGIEE